jgi:hypothetical protein
MPLALCLAAVVPGCSLFDTREPQPPSSSTCASRPRTLPGIVITNLQGAVAEKCVSNYADCFATSSTSTRAYTFVPSGDAYAQYQSIFSAWTSIDERNYFQNLVTTGKVQGFSNLLLTPKDSLVSSDSVTYNYDYVFTFEQTDTGFPNTARGSLQFTLGRDNDGINWSIYRWSDFKTTNDITWSSFKGKFSR